MRVVVEGAPANAACILRIGCELIMNASVAQRVLALALVVVGGLGGERVPDEFCIQIAWMVRRLQRETEVVHGKYVFKKFRFLEVADAASLAQIVESVRKRIGSRVEVVV